MTRSQDMIFTLFGDHIRHRGDEVWVGSLIELLGHLGMSPQAVRSALSRLSRKGWLKARRAGKSSYYSLTPRSVSLFTTGAQRIFEPPRRNGPWDGQWRLLSYSIPERQRRLRNKLRNELTWLGYGPLNNGLWISPHDRRQDVLRVLDALGVRERVEMFEARHLGFTDYRDLVQRCWDLQRLNEKYAAFITTYELHYQADLLKVKKGGTLAPSECYARRFMLIHEYRQFPFIDPYLPAELLPPDWLGDQATELFQAYHKLLTEQANRLVDAVLERAPGS